MPKPLSHNQPTVRLGFRVLQHEADLIEAAAIHAGLTLSAYLREMVRFLPTPDHQPIVPQHFPDPTDKLPPPKPPLQPIVPHRKFTRCERCTRIGAASCPACKRAAGLL